MDRGEALLQGLRGQLRNWLHVIKRSTYATDAELLPGVGGEFSVRVTWVPRGGATTHFERQFTRSDVFGPTYTEGPGGWRVQRKACVYAREIISAVLTARGV